MEKSDEEKKNEHPLYQQILRQQQQQVQQQQRTNETKFQTTDAQMALEQVQQQQLLQQQQLQLTIAKPVAGTDEWHRIRKSNHKEVERRRRENINLGIKELSALLPNQDSNKLQTLRNAVEYIKRLKENENNNIEKWTLEKLLTDQAVSELLSSNEKLKQELEKLYREIEHWKKIAASSK